MQITKRISIKELIKQGDKCIKCGNCCKFGSGYLIDEDIQKIANLLKISEKELKEIYLDETEIFNTKRFQPKRIKRKKEGIELPFGQCMFLDGTKCKINEAKPLLCRISTCSENGDDIYAWFLVKYFLNPNEPESVRQYASYIKTGGRIIKDAELNQICLDKETLKKILSYERLK